jgi:hypothetical protein
VLHGVCLLLLACWNGCGDGQSFALPPYKNGLLLYTATLRQGLCLHQSASNKEKTVTRDSLLRVQESEAASAVKNHQMHRQHESTAVRSGLSCARRDVTREVNNIKKWYKIS